MIRTKTKNHIVEIFDPIRKKWIQQTDEELVRQYFIQFLIREKQIPASRISVEKQIEVNGLVKRYDIVVYNQQGTPEVVIECKSPKIKITQDTLAQAGRYNSVLKAPIIGVTNGIEHCFFTVDFDTGNITKIEF